MIITLNADWLSHASDEDINWLLARAERYGWTVLVEGLKKDWTRPGRRQQ